MSKVTGRTRGTLFLIAARVISLFASLIAVPLQIAAVGPAGYGVSVFVLSLGVLVGMVDPGYLEGSQYRLTEARDAGDESEFRQTWHDVWSLATLIALAGAALFLLIPRVYPAPDYTGEQSRLFLAGGLWFATLTAFTALSTYLVSTRQLVDLAVQNFVGSFGAAVLATSLARQSGDPSGILFGTAAGQALAIGTTLVRHHLPPVVPPSGWRPRRWRRYLEIGIKSIGNRFLHIANASADRLLVAPVLGTAALANLATASRVPTALGEISGQMQTTVRPDITSAHLRSEPELARAFDRYTRLSMAVAVCLVLPLCSFGQILTLWLGDQRFDGGAQILLIAAWGVVLSSYLSILGVAAIAVGRAHLITPAMVVTAVATVGLTIPLARTVGLAGVAAIKPVVHAVTLVPLLLFLRKTMVPSLDPGPHLRRVAGILAVGGVVSAAAVALDGTPWVARWPIATLPLAGLLTYAALVAIHRFRLAELPEPIVRRARLGG